jgi:hypothetical protein
MSGFKKSQPGLRYSGEKVSPDEIDRYEFVNFCNPAPATTQWWGSAPVSGTADTQAFTIVNMLPDYPRNVQFILASAGSLTGLKGTAVINGYDQFGSVITETFSIAAGTGAGTVAGTKVFGRFTSGTCYYGTFSTSGTPNLGFTGGTNTLLGLPVKLAGTTDVALISHHAGTGAVTVNGGTVGGYINVAMSAVRPAATLTGTETVTVWVKPSYNPENIPTVANLKYI